MVLIDPRPKIGILVVAYNAATTLASVLERIPADVRGDIAHVLVSDDHSSDDTFRLGLELQRADPALSITVVRQPRNLGYGGNQKFGYAWAVEHGIDVVVMLHGDGQYAPERLADLYGPIVAGDADVVMGSRMLVTGAARAGGMPLYKYAGNRVLTAAQNAISGLHLSEWHSGYRAFSTRSLASVPFAACSDGFDFDTEVLLQLHDVGARILEVPIPTYYGDEICYVAGIPYACEVMADVIRYRLQRIGFGDGSLAVADRGYELKPDRESSHGVLLDRVLRLPPSRVLDLGCGDGALGTRMRAGGHHVTGIDVAASPVVKERLDEFLEADLDDGLPAAVLDGERYATVVAADVLEHVRRPEVLLAQIKSILEPGGRVLVSVPNFGHWYPRARTALGRFDYDRRGILDEDHVRFFTRRGFERLLHRSGWHIVEQRATGLPFAVADRGGSGGLGQHLRRTVGRMDRLMVRGRPTLFGYQLLYEVEPSLSSVDRLLAAVHSADAG